MKKAFVAVCLFVSTCFGRNIDMVAGMLEILDSNPNYSLSLESLFMYYAKEVLETTFADGLCEKGNKKFCIKAAIIEFKTKRKDKAAYYLEKAGCEYGDEDICAVLAKYYDNVYEFDKAIDYAKKGCALKKGQKQSCYYLGLFNEAGIVFEGGKQDAKKYYQKACNTKNANACQKLKSL